MKANKHSAIPKPFISMTDMLVSLNAGLLVLGILSAVDPLDRAAWQRVQQETVRLQQAAAELRVRTQALQRRHQAVVAARPEPKAAPAGKVERAPKAANTNLASNQ